MGSSSIWLTFWSDLGPVLAAVAWPLTILGIAGMFRPEIAAKIRSITRASGWGGELLFDALLLTAESTGTEKGEPPQAVKEPVINPANARPSKNESEGLDFLDDYPPLTMQTSAASRLVDVSFRDLAATLREYAGAEGWSSSGQKRYVDSMVRDLLKDGRLTEDEARRIKSLKALRNLAVASPFELTAERMLRYEAAIKEMQSQLIDKLAASGKKP